jgi:hypothetical protein
MSATRKQCRGCSAMILEITAVANSGYCGTCARTRGWRYRLQQIGFILSSFGAVLSAVLCGPFFACFFAIRGWFRRKRFPFDAATLLSVIGAVHPPDIAAAYCAGVIDGYWERAPEAFGWARNQPRFYGRVDGGRLRRGELALSSIPTHRERMIIEGRLSGVRFQHHSESQSS